MAKSYRHFFVELVLLVTAILMGWHWSFCAPAFAVTDATISINLGTLSPLDVMAGRFGSTSQGVNITTDNYTGYNSVLTNPNNSTDLINTTDNTLIIPTITLPQGSSSIAASGFTSGYGISTDGTNYVPSPSSASNIPIGYTNASGTTSHTLTFGAKPAPDTTAGSYSKVFVVTAVANNPQYSITYNANAGSDTVTGMPTNQIPTPTTASTITLSSDTPSRDNYTFLGWDTDPTVTTPSYPAGSSNTIDVEPTQPNNIKLYAIWEESGEVKITGISYVSGINVNGTPNPSVDSDGIVDFDLIFKGGLDDTSTLRATYQLTITNTTPSDYAFTPPASNLKLRISANEVRDVSYELSGISAGDTIPGKGGTVTFNIILNADYVSGEHGVEGDIEVEPVNQSTPNMIGSIYGSNTSDLSGNNNITQFQISVESTFEESNTFTINSLNSDFEIVDSNGNPLGDQTIAANSTNIYTFYMKKANGAKFPAGTATAGITIAYNSTYTNVGEVKITVDEDQSFVDSQPPTISSLSIDRSKTVDGQATLTWSGTDNVGIASYGIYKCSGSTCDNMISVSGLTNSYTFNGLSDGSYYFIVVGYDDEGNTASQSDINNANSDPGPASRLDISLSWLYTVSYSISNGGMTNTSGTTVRAGGTWQGTITANSGYQRPANKEDISVVMDGQSYTGFSYNNYVVTIQNASGNITISATLECLIEGTMIAIIGEDGIETSKPVEDITYKDRLKVWNHETGTIGYTYPARIEKERQSLIYQLTTFSDGTELGTVGWHGVFDANSNEYISVDDPTKFYPGVEVYKVDGDQLSRVTVEKIEIIEKEVKVYHIISSRYYNVIANNILTTDGNVITSNFYGFDENLKWPSIRDEFMSNPENLYTYDDFADIGIPERMFNDLRLEEASYLNNYGITLEMFKGYLLANGVLSGMVPYDE